MKRLAAIAGAAALITGFVTGTLITIRDEAWPGRGGTETIFQIGFLFSAYAFLIALPLGTALSFTLSPVMAATGLNNPLLHLAIGLLIGLLAHLLVDVGIGERIDRSEDFLGGTLAGGAAGLLWWFFVQRHEEEAR
jgi:hypothetical protein